MHKLFAALLACCLLALPAFSHARAEDDAAGSEGVASAPQTFVVGARLQQLRLLQREERRREGFWLLGWGVLNAGLGGALSVAYRDSPPALGAALTSASFGLINAALSFALLDLSEKQKRALSREPVGTGTEFAAQRERAMVAQLKSGQGYALNAGLDVFYIASGALLFALGQAYGKRWGAPEGAGLAMVGEGAFLLGFDLVSWLFVNRRAEALRSLR